MLVYVIARMSLTKGHFEWKTRSQELKIELELCPKDTDAPTDNIYMVYNEKINKGP
jgi:hypothetical protein